MDGSPYPSQMALAAALAAVLVVVLVCALCRRRAKKDKFGTPLDSFLRALGGGEVQKTRVRFPRRGSAGRRVQVVMRYRGHDIYSIAPADQGRPHGTLGVRLGGAEAGEDITLGFGLAFPDGSSELLLAGRMKPDRNLEPFFRPVFLLEFLDADRGVLHSGRRDSLTLDFNRGFLTGLWGVTLNGSGTSGVHRALQDQGGPERVAFCRLKSEDGMRTLFTLKKFEGFQDYFFSGGRRPWLMYAGTPEGPPPIPFVDVARS